MKMKSMRSSLGAIVSVAVLATFPVLSVRGDTGDLASGAGLDASMPNLDLSAASAYSSPGGGAASALGSGLLGADDSAWSSRTVGLKGGVGFTVDPSSFLLTLQADFFLIDLLAVGPLVQLGVSDHNTILAPTLNFQFVFDLPWQEVEALKPTAQFGLGFAYLHKNHRQGHDDDVGFLVNFGFGAEYFLTSQVALGTNFLFNFLPHETLDVDFFFSWQVVTVRFQF
jgi:hypothetical protein